jgi:hypothetical protein
MTEASTTSAGNSSQMRFARVLLPAPDEPSHLAQPQRLSHRQAQMAVGSAGKDLATR